MAKATLEALVGRLVVAEVHPEHERFGVVGRLREFGRDYHKDNHTAMTRSAVIEYVRGKTLQVPVVWLMFVKPCVKFGDSIRK